MKDTMAYNVKTLKKVSINHPQFGHSEKWPQGYYWNYHQ
jgi:hypothetical protein